MIRKREKARDEGLLVEFYGGECPHCAAMKPLVERLEKELGIKVEKYEVWHNSANAQRMEQLAELFEEACGTIGVPAFYNAKTGEAFCGETDYEKLRDWALGKREMPSGVT